MKSIKLVSIIICSVIVAFGVTAVVIVQNILGGSLMEMDGKIRFPSLHEKVEVIFDDYGVPNIKGKSKLDVARILGYLHAKERIYQMDRSRRRTAGRLAEIDGTSIESDKRNRRWGFQEKARVGFHALSPKERDWLEAYSEGVNFGIESFKRRPWEYIFQGVEIEPWKPEDCLLVAYGIYLDLQRHYLRGEKCRALMRDVLPQDVFAFFVENVSDWESTIGGTAKSPLEIPPEKSFDYLKNYPGYSVYDSQAIDRAIPGSNAWAVSGKLTGNGSAIVANDMHLGLGVPNIWYRASFQYSRVTDGRKIRVYGATLPGLPLMVIGSNGFIAWGLTNANVDVIDLLKVDLDPNDMGRYITTTGSESFEHKQEIIKVKGKGDVPVSFKYTRWGPVLLSKFMRQDLAMRWTALESGAINLRLGEFEEVQTVYEAISLAPSIGIPTLNLIVGDRNGNIGWTLMGPIMNRVNYDQKNIVSVSGLEPEWEKLVDAKYPRVINPESGYVWNANNISFPIKSVGFGNSEIPARAQQIEGRLSALNKPIVESDLFEIQSDVEATFYFRWRDLLLKTLQSGLKRGNLRFAEMADIVREWDGYARADSVGFVLVRDFRQEVVNHVCRYLLYECFEEYKIFSQVSFRYDTPVWKIVSQQPSYLCDPRFENWNDYLIYNIEDQIGKYEREYGGNFSFDEINLGRINVSRISHPMSDLVPLVAGWINMKGAAVSGDAFVPNALTGNHGPSERMVVSPGFESLGIFHMPTGQSGHPMSEYYRKGHEEWLNGIPTALASGEEKHHLIFESRDL